MNKTKKVFALLLAVVFVFSSFAQAFAYQPPSDVVGSDIEDIATVLGGLNVMVGDGDTGNFVVPEGCFLFLGDNRNDSDDSRDPDLGQL